MKKTAAIRYGAMVTLVAFLMNVLLPFFAVYSFPQAASADSEASSSVQELAALFGEKILICTENGFKWVHVADLQSGKETPKPHAQYKCPLCYIAAHGIKHTAPARAVELAYTPHLEKLALFFPPSETLLTKPATRNHPSRAPPASFIA